MGVEDERKTLSRMCTVGGGSSWAAFPRACSCQAKGTPGLPPPPRPPSGQGHRLPGLWMRLVTGSVHPPSKGVGGGAGLGGVIQPAQALSLGTLQARAIASGGVPTHAPSFALVTD